MKANIVQIKDVTLESPIMIEGLPGVGHVGKLVAEHMVEELGGDKIIEIYSHHFPPQVLVMSDGTVELAKNEVYACSGGKYDLLILVGDYQSTTNIGHYELTNAYLDIAQKYGVTRIYTLGGYGVGHLVEKPRVLGAVNNIKLVDEMKGYGISFEEKEPGGGIIGASGLLLGMGEQKCIEAVCIMGETSGYIVDPRSAQAVLKSLSQALSMEIDMGALEDRAKDMEKIIARLKEMEQAPPISPIKEDLSYIG